MKHINKVLVAMGGLVVAHRSTDPDYDGLLVERGKLVEPGEVALRQGDPETCHRNTAAHFLLDYPAYRIATGYALDDFMWVRHSWLLSGDTIIETARRKRLYFGVTLDEAEASRFVMEVASEFTGSVRADAEEQAAGRLPLRDADQSAPRFLDVDTHVGMPGVGRRQMSDAPLQDSDGLSGPVSDPEHGTKAEIKARVFGHLASLGAVTVYVEYDGMADDGAIAEISCRGPGEAVIELPPHVREAVEDFVYESLPCGWETDGGGWGLVEFDIADGTVLFRHTQRFVESYDSEWEV